MKQCYFCNQAIPDDAHICPMCGMELPEYNQSTPVSDLQPHAVNFDAISRKDDNQINPHTMLESLMDYVYYLANKIKKPFETDSTHLNANFYGYFTIIFSAFLLAGTVTRIVAAWEDTYSILSSISILPVATFTFNWIEWFIKLAIFFFVYAYFISYIAFLFQRSKEDHDFSFSEWVLDFTGMNALYSFVLIIVFLTTLIAPLALGIPTLLFVFIYLISYVVGFLISLKGTNINKIYYQGLISISIHFLIMAAVGYLLIKI